MIKIKPRENEKDIISFMLFLVVCFLLIYVLVISLSSVVNEPHFKIYKEECFTDRNISEIEYSSFGDIKNLDENNLSILQCSLGDEEEYIDANGKVCEIIYLREFERCEKVEVDEITLRCYDTFGDLIPCEDVPCDFFMEDSYCLSIDENQDLNAFYRNKLIEKKDLTIEWLEENCKPPECVGYGCSFIGDCNKCNMLGYKCGEDYFVETWGQIK